METRGFVRAYNNLRCYSLDSGLAGLIACRTGGIRLARHAALAQLIHASYANCCPCCKVPVRESLAHLFLDCSAWKTQRAAHLKVVISKIRNAVTGLRGSEVVTLLLGGRTRNFTLGAAWLSGSASRPAYYLNVVRFLAAIKSQRNKFFFVARNTPAPAESCCSCSCRSCFSCSRCCSCCITFEPRPYCGYGSPCLGPFGSLGGFYRLSCVDLNGFLLFSFFSRNNKSHFQFSSVRLVDIGIIRLSTIKMRRVLHSL